MENSNSEFAATSQLLVSVGRVAKMLECSRRHIYRLRDAGKMPRPVRVGDLVRSSI